MNEEYFYKVDKLMCKRGYTLMCICNPHTEHESRSYSQMPRYSPQMSRLDNGEDKVIIEVASDKRFQFFYTNLPMCAILQTSWFSPINNKEHFDKMLAKFLRSVNALRKEWGD